MTAYEIADELDTQYGNPLAPKQYDIIKAAIAMLRMQADEIDAARQVIQSIANEQVELSHDKIKWQNGDHIKWCNDYLNKVK